MSNYINTSTGEYPVSFARVKQALPNMSFSTAPDAAGDFKRVGDGPIPTFNADTQYVTEGAPTLSGGAYVRNWVVSNYTADEVAQKQANKDAVAAKSNRKKRNDLISATDYFALTDVTMDAAMTTYRQALRDITSHANWPHLGDDDWPVKP